MKPLTQRQQQVLQVIADSWKQGRPPTTPELLEKLNLATVSGLDNVLSPIKEKGFITIAPTVRGRQRLIELTSIGKAATGFGIPLLGEIPAGPIAEAIQECDEWMDGYALLLNPRPGDFGLRVKGDSMIGDGILPGDRILLRPNIDWRPNEIVAAQVDMSDGTCHGTLKHIELIDGGKTVRLRASNPAYDDMEFDARRVSVAGVARGLIRLME